MKKRDVGRSSWWSCWQRQGDRTQYAGQERQEVLKGGRNCNRRSRRPQRRKGTALQAEGTAWAKAGTMTRHMGCSWEWG